jgi:hypothetical protein
MSSVLDSYWRVYAWMSSAPVPLVVVLTAILLVTVPAAANAIVAAVLALIRSGVRLLGRDNRARRGLRPHSAFRHAASQLISLILLLSWAS